MKQKLEEQKKINEIKSQFLKDEQNWQTFSQTQIKEKAQMNKTKNEEGDVTTDTTEIQKISVYYE